MSVRSTGLTPALVLPSLLKHVSFVSPTATLPATTDLRSLFPPVYDQGQLGSCTANAACSLVEILSPTFLGSRMFLWYQTRVLENKAAQNAGVQLHDIITTLKTFGMPAEVDWPYVATQYAVLPPPTVYALALQHLALQCDNIPNDVQQLKGALTVGLPWMTGIPIYTNMEPNFAVHGGNLHNVFVKGTGIFPMPGATDTVHGYHAVCIVGYDDAKKWWIVRNSWGALSGDGGYYYIPYTYMALGETTSDNWVIQTMSNTASATTAASASAASATTATTAGTTITGDCKVSDWTVGACSATTCGTSGMQSMTRKMVTAAVGTGAACPALTQTQACQASACPVDCAVGPWAPYPSCLAKACGVKADTQTSTRKVVTAPANGGAACPVLTMSQPCSMPCKHSASTVALIAAGVGVVLLVPLAVLGIVLAL